MLGIVFVLGFFIVVMSGAPCKEHRGLSELQQSETLAFAFLAQGNF